MSHNIDTTEMEHRLWKELEKARFGMLGLAGGPPHHMQPMTAYREDGTSTIWFFCRRDNDLLRETGAGHTAMFCIMAKDQEFQACVGGTLSADHDRARIDQFWNPVAAAWFPEGKEDPELTLLRFEANDAQVWASHSGPVRFGWEIAKATLTGKTPDVGDAGHIELR